VKRYTTSYDIVDMEWTIIEDPKGGLVKWEDVEPLLDALREIARGKAPEDYGLNQACIDRLTSIAIGVLEDL